ncbi:MAG: hypothetical protein GX298_00970, partial [Planctomycetes bacterium]|nr:hypothetical protein [Planctomycetota bacterium]
MLSKKAKQILKQFQCDYNRELEERFAQTFSEEEQLRLFFINENAAYTDGRNIIVDPAVNGLFADRAALRQTEVFLDWPCEAVSGNPWRALRMVTRAQTIHECLHILYTDFPSPAGADPRCDTRNKTKAMAMIDNIIEDAYIEAVGCSVYDNLELFLQFARISSLFVSAPSEGTVRQVFGSMSESSDEPWDEAEATELAAQIGKIRLLEAYLNHMIDLLLYPMVETPEPEPALASYVEQTVPFFFAGSAAAAPADRHRYAQQIFDRILPLIPDDREELGDAFLERKLGGTHTHQSVGQSIGSQARRGRAQVVNVRLFADLDGKPRDPDRFPNQLAAVLDDFDEEKEMVLALINDEGSSTIVDASQCGATPIHNKIKIHVHRPKINLNLRRAYQNMYQRFRININSYNTRFRQLLQAAVPQRDTRYLFGEGISSRKLGDVRKRYWYRHRPGVDLPDLAVLLLIDGSGSMSWENRSRKAMESALILHEVLRKQGMEHAIVEHRANFEDPEMEVNILVDFHPRKN